MAFGVSGGGATGEFPEGCAKLFAFNWNGRLRSGFSNDGKKNICPARLAEMFPPLELDPKGVNKSQFALQGNGKTVVALALLGPPIRGGTYVLRLKVGGQIDRTFAENGLFRTGIAEGGIPVEGLKNGVLLSAGTDELPGKPSSYIYRFLP